MGFLLENGGPNVCRYETLSDSQTGLYLLGVAISNDEWEFVTLLLSQSSKGNTSSAPTKQPDRLHFELSLQKPVKTRPEVLAELWAWFSKYPNSRISPLNPTETLTTLLEKFRRSKSNYSIDRLIEYTSAAADHLAIAMLQSLMQDHGVELERLGIPRNLSDRINASKYASRLEQVLDPSFAFNKTTMENARAVVQQALEISRPAPANDKSLIAKPKNLENDQRLISFLCQLDFGEVSQLEDELRPADTKDGKGGTEWPRREGRVPAHLQCFEYSYAIRLNSAMESKDKYTLKRMFASEDAVTAGYEIALEPNI
jgi:hypothetical protein